MKNLRALGLLVVGLAVALSLIYAVDALLYGGVWGIGGTLVALSALLIVLLAEESS